jgi:hypothetical protein
MLEEKTIGKITIGTDIEMNGNIYLVPVEDSSIKIRGAVYSYILEINRELVEQEFYMKGKNRMVQSFYYAADDDRDQRHELSFNEFEEYDEYRKEFDSFVMEIAAEVLHLQDLAEARELNVKYFAQMNNERLAFEEKVRELEKKLYEVTNPRIKRAS